MNRLLFACLIAALSTGCGSDDKVDAGGDAPPRVGTVSLSWTIDDGAGGTLTCEDVDGQAVRVALTEENSGFGEVAPFTCDAANGMSANLGVGTYFVEIDLRTSFNRSLIENPIALTDIVINQGEDTPLGAQAFTVDPTGQILFFVDSTANANCTPEASGGAELDAIVLELRDGSGTCVPTTFTIDDGTQPGGTYTNDCVTPGTFTCIENDQAVRVDATDSGPSELIITGQRAGNDCYQNVTQFPVPGGQHIANLGNLSMDTFGVCAPDAM